VLKERRENNFFFHSFSFILGIHQQAPCCIWEPVSFLEFFVASQIISSKFRCLLWIGFMDLVSDTLYEYFIQQSTDDFHKIFSVCSFGDRRAEGWGEHIPPHC
jgi:hypothetical protein